MEAACVSGPSTGQLNNVTFAGSHSLLDYCQLVNQHGVLLPLVNELCHEGILSSCAQSFAGPLSPSSVMSSLPTLLEITHDLACIGSIMASQKWCAQPEQQLASVDPDVFDNQAGGACVLGWIAEQIGLHPCGGSARGLHTRLINSSLVQMHLARDMAVAALMLALQPGNCLTLLSAAQACGSAPLYNAARACALKHFQEVVGGCKTHLRSLPSDQLVSLLCDDALTVDGEGDVFLAILAYMGEGATLEGLQALSSQCVRTSLLNLSELESLDMNTEVAKSDGALRLVAGWYISCLFGNVAPGASSTARRCSSGTASLMSSSNSSFMEVETAA